MADIEFGGAAPDDDDRADLVQQIIAATVAYAQAARERGGLHFTKRIAVAVPVDAVKRPLFEEAEATLWDLGVRLDWSAYTTWFVPHHLAEGFEPLDWIAYSAPIGHSDAPAGWRVSTGATRLPFSMSPAETRAYAARLLAAADACEEHNRLMPAPPAEPLPGI